MNDERTKNERQRDPLQCDTCMKPPLDPETERSGQQCRRKYGGNNRRCPGVLMTTDESTNAILAPQNFRPSPLRSPDKVRNLSASDLGLDKTAKADAGSVELICDTCKRRPRATKKLGSMCQRLTSNKVLSGICRGTIREKAEGENYAELGSS